MSQTALQQTLLGKSPEQSTVWRDKGYGASWAKCPGFRRRSPKGSPRSRAITRMLGPLIVYTDLIDLGLLATFDPTGEVRNTHDLGAGGIRT